jgi:hypothetical protein
MSQCWRDGLLSPGMRERYKKGRPLWWDLREREEGSSEGFAPRPPRFNALVPVRNLGKGKTGSFADPGSVPAPGSALGVLLSRALSSTQAEAIVAKRKEREKQWSEFSRRPSSGRLFRQTYEQPFNGSALNPEGSIE